MSLGHRWWWGEEEFPTVRSQVAWVDCAECLWVIADGWVSRGSREWEPLVDWVGLGCPRGWTSIRAGSRTYLWFYAPMKCDDHP